ncbi:MAG: nucleoside monophosphate kinase [Desulfovibrionaceae bacterium]
MNILFFGPNGSGKGTQAIFLQRELSLEHIETGAIFRKHILENTELGKKAKEYIDKGILVPDNITIPMILSAISSSTAKGWLLDGFPRNDTQARSLNKALQEKGIKIDAVVEITLDRSVAKKRIMGRRTCIGDPAHANNLNIPSIAPNDEKKCRICGMELKVRMDDIDEETINQRHAIYYDEKFGTVAAMKLYIEKAKDDPSIKYIVMDGSKPIEEINKELLRELHNICV